MRDSAQRVLRQHRPPRPGDRPPAGQRTPGDGGGPRAQPRGLRRPAAHRPRHRADRPPRRLHRRARRRPPRPPLARARPAVQRAARRHVPHPGVPAHRAATRSPRSTSTALAVEPLIHACAELLDNATRYSPPHTKVHVTAVEVQTGIAIEIEDGGVSLSEEARAKVENMLAQAQAGHRHAGPRRAPRASASPSSAGCRTMYNMQVSLRHVRLRRRPRRPRRAARHAHHEPAPGLAHGIGATAVPRSIGQRRRRRPQAHSPRSAVARPPDRGSRVPRRRWSVGPGMEDDVPVVTEWTPTACRSAAAGTRSRSASATPRPPPQEAAAEAADGRRPGRRPEPEPEPGEEAAPARPVGRGVHGRTQGRPGPERLQDSPDDPTAYRTYREHRAAVPRPTTRGTSSDPAAGQLRLDAQGAGRRRTGHPADRGALRRRPAHRPPRRRPRRRRPGRRGLRRPAEPGRRRRRRDPPQRRPDAAWSSSRSTAATST